MQLKHKRIFLPAFTGICILFGFLFPMYPYGGPFSDNLDGTISAGDGLVWQKCSMGQGITVCSSPAATTSDWNTALNYCNSLNLTGRTWRLPNVKELSSILDYGKTSFPIINTTLFPNTSGNYYWTSTSGVSSGTSPNTATDNDPVAYIATSNNDNAYRIAKNTKYRAMAYVVDFRMGGIIEFPKTNSTSAYVRCISGP
ncbi:hypothetical protein A0128_13845 [Leptospira tipperaryensis]|uniref:Lcl C-terminal domain-containing protein n=1 Tax=Leptospira tipperaryensis TaxID=2564040 RepID=A0A1D7UZ29_9LEPT|nr:DUF1566 domain-containing protein [Leptospira tipperaryensis]AOP34834.1 hypothetical protein A0128_13845 [Leptospira tipperaryensis]